MDCAPDGAPLLPAAGPPPRGFADTTEVEAQRVEAAAGDRARERRDERVAHRPAVRRQGMRDHDDAARRLVGDAERPLEPACDAYGLLAHPASLSGNPAAGVGV